jgi:hypothetical protein
MMPAHNQGGIERQESEGSRDPAPSDHRSTNPSAEREGVPPKSSQMPSNSASKSNRASQTVPTTEEDIATQEQNKDGVMRVIWGKSNTKR